MASNHTSNYNLNQWAADDRVLRTDFNADNVKIDTAVAGLQTTVNGLMTGKADKSALEALKSTVSQQGTALAGKGNCQLYTTRYTGSGTCEAPNPNTLTFPAVPEAVLIAKNGYMLVLIPGETFTWTLGAAGGAGSVTVSWSGRTVQWYASNERGQMNERGMSYPVFALIKAG